MLKKILTLSMILALFSVSSFAASKTGLKAAFDELNYSLTVEWDQKDSAFYQAQIDEFTKEVQALQANGLTNAELIDFVKSEIKDQKISQDFVTALNVISLNKMSSEEASVYMRDFMTRSYTSGASWVGDYTFYAGILVTVVVVAVIILFPVNSKCEPVYFCDSFNENCSHYCAPKE